MSDELGSSEALHALERLHAKKVITLEEGQAAARILTRDENVVFPRPPRPPAPPAEAPPAEAPPAAGVEPAPAAAPAEPKSEGAPAPTDDPAPPS